MRVVKHWNTLPRKAAESPSLHIFKTWPDMAREAGLADLQRSLPTQWFCEQDHSSLPNCCQWACPQGTHLEPHHVDNTLPCSLCSLLVIVFWFMLSLLLYTTVSSPELRETSCFWLIPTIHSPSPPPALIVSIIAMSRNLQPSLFSSNPPLWVCSNHRSRKKGCQTSLPPCVSLAPHLLQFWSFPWTSVMNELKTHFC